MPKRSMTRFGARAVAVGVAVAAVVLSVLVAPPAQAVDYLTVRVLDLRFDPTSGITVTLHDFGTGALVQTALEGGRENEYYFTDVPDGLYEVRGTDGYLTGEVQVSVPDTDSVTLYVHPPIVPVTVTGTVPVIEGGAAGASIQLTCAPNYGEPALAASDGSYSVTVDSYAGEQCSLELNATPYDGRVRISRDVDIVDGVGTASFSYPDPLDVSVVNADDSPATAGHVEISAAGWKTMPDGSVVEVETWLDRNLALGDATALLTRGTGEYELTLPGGYRVHNYLGLVGLTELQLKFPAVEMVTISGTAPIATGPEEQINVKATCGPDDDRIQLEEAGHYALSFLTLVTPSCSRGAHRQPRLRGRGHHRAARVDRERSGHGQLRAARRPRGDGRRCGRPPRDRRLAAPGDVR